MAFVHLFARRHFRLAFLVLSCLVASQSIAQAADELVWIRRGDYAVTDIAYSPVTGRMYSSAVGPCSVKSWQQGATSFTTSFHRDLHTMRMELSRDGSLLVLAGERVTFLSAITGRVLNSWHAFGGCSTVEIAPDNSYVLVPIGYPYVHINLVKDNGATWVREFKYWSWHYLYDIEIAPNTRSFVACGASALTRHQINATWPDFTYEARTYCADISSNGELLATGHDDGKVIIWDYATMTPLRTLYGSTTLWVQSVKFDEVTGNLLAVQHHNQAGTQANLFAWNLQSGQVAFQRYIGKNPWTMSVPPSGDVFYAGTAHEGVLAINRFSGATQQELSSMKGPPSALEYAQDGAVVVTASRHVNQYTVQSAANGNILWSYRADPTGPSPLAVSRDGTRLAIADGEFLKVLDVATGSVLKLLRHRQKAESLAFSPDGSTVAFGDNPSGQSPKVILWDLSSGQTTVLTSFTQEAEQLAFTPDGSLLLVGWGNGWLHSYRMSDRQLVKAARFDQVTPRFALSPDGGTMAVTSASFWHTGFTTLRTETFEEVSQVHLSYRPSLEFSRDGSLLFLGSDIEGLVAYRLDDGVRVWTSSHQELRAGGIVAVSPATGDLACYRADGSLAILANPMN